MSEPLRPAIPSSREVEQGMVGAEPVFDARASRSTDAEEASSGLNVGERAKAFVKTMDVRDITRTHGSRPVLVMGLTGALQGLAAAALGVNFLRLRDDLGLRDTTIVLLGVVSTIVGTLGGPLVGFVADRVSRVRIGLIGAVGFGATTAVLGLQRTVFAYAVASLGQRLFGGILQNSTTLPLLSDYYPPEVRGRIFAVPQLIGSAGAVIGPVLGAVLGVALGTFTTIGSLGALSMLAALGWATLREPQRGRWDRLRLGADEALAGARLTAPSFAESYRTCANVRTLRRVWAASVFTGIGGQFLLPLTLVIASRSIGASPLALAPIIVGQQLVTVAGIAVGGALTDRLVLQRPGNVMVAIGAIQLFNLAALLGLGLTGNPLLVIPLIVAQPFISVLPETAKNVLMSLVIPARVRAFGLQMAGVWGLLGFLALPILIGILDSGDAIQAAFLVASPLMLIGALIYLTAATDVEKDIEAARQAIVAEQAVADSFVDGVEKLVVCRKVDVGYDGVQVLFGVDLDIERGEVLALLGTNGAGKSTILRALAGLASPSGGAVVIAGRDTTRTPPHELARLGVVLVPGGKGVFANLSVAENLRAAAYLEPAEHDERRARVLDLFPRLVDRLDTAAGSLSGGEQQMVALGQALMMDPTLLLIDELSLGLAPAVVEELLRAVETMRDQGITIVIVEQSVNVALTVADRAVFLEKGEVRFEGPTAELRRRPDILRSVYLRGTGGTAVRATARPLGETDRALALEVEGIVVSYGGVRALDGASITVRPGEVVGIVGPNGAGKTTLFDVISGFTEAEAGTVRLLGKDITQTPADVRARLGLGRSFQDARLFGSLTVTEALQVSMERQAGAARSAALAALWLPQVRRAERSQRRRADGLIDLLGLGAFRDKFVSELSTGSRRVVDLACVLASAPEVLLLDEPAAGIAQSEAEELPGTLERIRRETGCGMLVIEHDVRLLTTIADRLVGMVLGRTLVEGAADHVLSDPELVAAYLGSSERAVARSGAVADTDPAETEVPAGQP